MANGYTANLKDGEQSFKDFALRCAHGMGAFINQRDESLDSKLRKLGPDTDYYNRIIDKAQEKHDEFVALDEPQQFELYEKYVQETVDAYDASEKERKAIRARYAGMLAEVIAWDIPESLESLRSFMEQQLRDSISFDTKKRPLSVLDFDEWIDDTILRMENMIANAEKNKATEIRRSIEQNQYYSDLMASLEDL